MRNECANVAQKSPRSEAGRVPDVVKMRPPQCHAAKEDSTGIPATVGDVILAASLAQESPNAISISPDKEQRRDIDIGSRFVYLIESLVPTIERSAARKIARGLDDGWLDWDEVQRVHDNAIGAAKEGARRGRGRE